MPASLQIFLDRFQLARVPSLPPLILKEIFDPSQQQRSSGSLAELLKNDVFLFAKVLGNLRYESINSATSSFEAEQVVDSVGLESIEALISQSAMQSCYEDMDRSRLNFYKMHWRQSFLGRVLARELALTLQLENVEEAAFAGQFLNLGELVLEDLFAEQYRRLHETVQTEAGQIKEEKERLGFSHAEIGSELLSQWGFEAFICDALHYHQEALNQVLDASVLVKVCWLANLMAGCPSVDASIFEAGESLFGLSATELIELHAGAMVELKQAKDTLNLQFNSESRLPLQIKDIAETIAEDEKLGLELNEQVRNINRFNAVRSNFAALGSSTSREKLGVALGEALNILFGFYECIVFCLDRDGDTLHVKTSSLLGRQVDELQIKCEEGRSVIADSYLNGASDASSGREGDLSVIDRQILSLLGKTSMACDPIIMEGEVQAVLVMGIQQSQSTAYFQQTKIRELLKIEILNSLVKLGKSSSQMSTALDNRVANIAFQQRINETIHEVNNPLSIIKNYLQLLSIKQKDDASFLDEINIIKTEIDRVSNLLGGLKGGVSSNEEETDDVNANMVIKSLCKVFSASMFSSKLVSFELDLAPDLPLISFKESAFKQIITNLLKNAVEAIEDKGHIVINTYGNIFLNGSHYIQVEITDDGPGIDAIGMNKLFVPGYSSKGVGHSGSGLAIVKGLLENMGGQISCRSNKSGSTFSMLFLRSAPLQKEEKNKHGINKPRLSSNKLKKL